MADTDTITLLKSIDASLKHLISLSSAKRTPATPPAHAPKADDSDLDGKYGDPIVRFNPRDWTGADHKSRKFSECDPKFLDMLAAVLDYFGEQAEKTNEQYNGKPTAPYKRKDAARARGWAMRIRAGYKPAAAADFDSKTGEIFDAKPAAFETSEWPDEDL